MGYQKYIDRGAGKWHCEEGSEAWRPSSDVRIHDNDQLWRDAEAMLASKKLRAAENNAANNLSSP